MSPQRDSTNVYQRTVWSRWMTIALLLMLGSCIMALVQAEDDQGTPKSPEDASVPQKESIRMITVEELSRNDGNQTEFLWLSIMGKVYDVSAGSQYYGPNGPYEVFVGRDANVPFITGNFTEEEANKSLLDLTAAELYNLETWTDFYDKEDKYTFMGLLIGELWDEEGNPTETHAQVTKRIEEGRLEAEERKRKRKEIIAKRKKEAAEKKRKKLEEEKAAASSNANVNPEL